MNAMHHNEGALSSLIRDIPKLHSTPEVRFEVEESDKFAIVERLCAALAGEKAEGVEVDTIDGARVKTSDGWWILRASNTQSVLVARAESDSIEGLERLKSMAAQAVLGAGGKLEFPA